MAEPKKSADEQRRETFRRMERVFVWGPPILLAAITIGASLLIALVAPVDGTTYWQRVAIVAFVIFVIPLAGYLIRNRRGDR